MADMVLKDTLRPHDTVKLLFIVAVIEGFVAYRDLIIVRGMTGEVSA